MGTQSIIEQGHDHGIIENPDAPFDKLVLQYGPPRSGTTLVYNSLNRIFKRVGKTHQYLNFEGLSGFPDLCDNVVATYRDFRDICVSIWRVENNIKPEELLNGGRKMTNQEILDFTSITHHRCLNLNRYIETKDEHNLLLLKYEDFYKNIPALIKEYEKHFDIEISEELKAEIESSCSLKAHKKIADSLDSFKEHEEISLIHGYHILKNGEPGMWKQLVGPDSQEMITDLLQQYLEPFGYIE